MTVSATTATTGSAAHIAASAPTSALGTLSGNLNSFLMLLMTQLKNQDPTSPMDTNAFTSQLVQYSSVEQQINTNTNLTNLITATQSNTVLQSSSLVGKQITVTNDHLTLQGSKARIHFDAPADQPITITVIGPLGEQVLQTNLAAQAGNNDWTWDGRGTDGATLADGAYKVVASNQSGAALATTVTGTVTGMQRTGTAVNAVMGGLQSDVSTIQTVVSES